MDDAWEALEAPWEHSGRSWQVSWSLRAELGALAAAAAPAAVAAAAAASAAAAPAAGAAADAAAAALVTVSQWLVKVIRLRMQRCLTGKARDTRRPAEE